jgi:tripartite-type tricarboxylate transporter receptor subunit TctC
LTPRIHVFARHTNVDARDKHGHDAPLTFIPYKGSAASVTDLLAGQTHFTIDAMVGLYPLIKDGKLRALGVARAALAGASRCADAAQSGFPDFTNDAWTGVAAPAGTPAEVVETLNRAINDGLRSAEMQENLARFSAIVKPGSPADFATFIAAELPKWSDLVALSGATAE